MVHTVEDKCTFIKLNCPDEEAGLLSYLRLYYCSLANAQPLAFTILVLWICMLFSTIGIAASDFLCINLSTIASILGMSESLTGVTFLAFGNGSPDVFSTFAAMSSHSGSLAVGELFGAAGFITAVVAASMALVKPFQVARKSFVRDVGFFIVAASFSMVFLVDGKLQIWECAVMIGFYVFYVIFVVTWHWYLGRRREQRLRLAAARLHHHIPQTQELDVETYPDDDEETPAHERTDLLNTPGAEDFSGLEADATSGWNLEDIDDDDEQRDRYLAGLRDNMRIRPSMSHVRRSTLTPIRPSLIGALEFRAVLNNLEKKATTSTTTPIGLRRYSDDPSHILGQAGDSHSVIFQPELTSNYSTNQPEGNGGLRPNGDGHARTRAVSADNAVGLRLDTSMLNEFEAIPESAVYSTSPLPQDHRRSLLGPALQSPKISVSPPASIHSHKQSNLGSSSLQSPGGLAPPANTFHKPNYQDDHQPDSHSPGGISPNSEAQKDLSLDIPKLVLPQAQSGSMTPKSPFPSYTESPMVSTPLSSSRAPSIRYGEASMSPASAPHHFLGPHESDTDDHGDMHTYKWWPYGYLPAPQIIAATMFPTVYGWRKKSFWDKMLGIVSLPSVFVLVATLPVVEPEQKHNVPDPDPDLLTPKKKGRSRTNTSNIVLPPDSPFMEALRSPGALPGSHPHFKSISRQNTNNSHHLSLHSTSEDTQPTSAKDWNRWLVFIQLFTAPLFLVLIIYANLDDSYSPKTLLILILSSLLTSLLLLLLLLFTSTPDKPPAYRPLFCFLGFIVAIAWISTIANEVVGVLKAFGVIVGMSEAILGLTIFAVGNSLGDLVADMTVARLGFPVMALSACFGGPMLNILLGIGVSGLYMNLRHGENYHLKHPHRPTKYKPYTVEISTTLIISGVMLLVTLVGLLVVVPLNKWRMDRRVGLGLITLWVATTIGNVIVEALGYGETIWRSG